MKLNETNLKEIVIKIKNNENYNNISYLISDVLSETYYSKDLFYTIEYTDIIINDNKKDNTFKNDFYQDILKMLLYMLRNKNINFNKRYFDIILKLVKIDQGLVYDEEKNQFLLDEDYNEKIGAVEYNKLLFFLSLDYSNSFINESSDQLFNTTINQNFEECFTNLLDTFAYFEDSQSLFEELSKYSPIITNTILKNKDYIQKLEMRKLNEFTSNIEIEFNLFNILVGIFISNIKEFNYNYQIISEGMAELMDFVMENYIHIFNQNNYISIQNMEDLKQAMYKILLSLSKSKRISLS